jgi:Flp pilus assembly secretin CpaC
MKKLTFVVLALGLQVASAQQPSGKSLDAALSQATEVSVAGPAQPGTGSGVPFTTDTQIRLLSLFDPQTNSDILRVDAARPKSDSYLTVENVPLRALFHLLALRSGLNYLEPESDLPNMDDLVTLEMKEPKPRDLMGWLLKHRQLELYDGGTGIYTIRSYTNQLSYHRFKLTDNFIDRFKGTAQASGGGAMSYGGYGGGNGGGNAVSASTSFTIENGGKYGDIEGLMEKVANSGDDKKSKVWYLEEKQYLLLYGTKQASERVANYLEIANMKNPNIRIDVRVYATGNNPTSQLGVDWSSLMSPGITFGIQPPGTTIGGSPGQTSGTNSSLFPAYNNLSSLVGSFGNPMSSVILQNNLNATLNFWVSDTRAETITEPSAITANGREVAFAATQQIPYVSGSAVAGNGYGSSTGNGYDNTSFLSVGASVNILPRIQDGNRIKLGTAISVSQLDQMLTIDSGTSGSGPRQVPETSGRAYNGEYTINSGDTVVIAGMKTHTVSKNLDKVPLLGDIPGLGKLFRNSTDSKQNNYLTIFITATILDGNNNPKIPEGNLTPKDGIPNEDAPWLTAEPNSRDLLKKELLADRSLINAKREALDVRTEQANRIIARRLNREEEYEKLNGSIAEKDDEIKAIEKERKQASKRHDLPEGSIEAVRKEAALRLDAAKEERSRLAAELKDCGDDLAKIALQEKEATKAKEKAEGEYTKALKDASNAPTPPPPAAPSGGPKPAQPEELKKELDNNNNLLNNL